LARDSDIVVIDAVNPFGFGKLFPAGLLREPVENLARANMFWLTKIECVSAVERERIKAELTEKHKGVPIVESRYEPVGLKALYGGTEAPKPDELKGVKALCVSGVGNPESFEALVESLTGLERQSVRFTDHHPFGDGDLTAVEDVAIKNKMEIILTTEKDATRLPAHFKPRCRWASLLVKTQVVSGLEYIEPILNLR
ncbi:MAG TPA: tetraacyldisaccharide 4'-kinase, partial [bacterium]|nr:tetraacyldisaccharide 4'-kinase [bacterium]